MLPTLSQIRKISTLILTSILVLTNAGYSQDENAERLRGEIAQFEKQLATMAEGRADAAQQLENIDRMINLRRRLVKQLEANVAKGNKKVRAIESRIREMDGQIKSLTGALGEKEQHLNILRSEVSERIRFIYKRRNHGKVAFVFGSRDLNDFVVRQKYLKSVEEYDRRSLTNLKDSRNEVLENRSHKQNAHQQLNLEKENHSRELKKVKSTLKERKNEEGKLQSERKEKNELLAQLSDNEEILKLLLEERKQSLGKIGDEIQRLVRDAVRVEKKFSPSRPFTSLAGKLPWPITDRRIVKGFGSIKESKYGTVVNNPGIDFAAKPGLSVHAVADGIVTSIRYLRGFGNIVFVSHGNGSYTTYAGIDMILVNEGVIVDSGDKLGEVGEEGVNSNFHFEVWIDRKAQNPKKWLKASK